MAASALAGCGGPSPQDAEERVRSEIEAGGARVSSVFCEEADGDRFECEVSWTVGAGPRTDRVIVSEDEL